VRRARFRCASRPSRQGAAISRLRGILFDKDGTLLDFEATWGPLYRRLALELAGDDLEKAQTLLLSGGLDPATGRVVAGSVLGAGTTHDIVDLWFPDLAEQEFGEMVRRIDAEFHAHGSVSSVPVPRLIETIQRLVHDGYLLGVATNVSTHAARHAIAAVGAEAHLPHVHGYDSVARPKPAPDLVHAFAAAAGLPTAAIAVVGDNRHDLEMARAAGAGAAIGVLTGNSSLADLSPLADAVLKSIADLPDWLAWRADLP
jgi:phosphoglycolate phosphatase